MWFAAKEAVQKRAAERGRREGIQTERERIKRALASRGITPPPEIASILADESETGRARE